MSGRKGTYEVTAGEETHAVDVRLITESHGIARYAVTRDGGRVVEVEVSRPVPGGMTLLLDGASFYDGSQTTKTASRSTSRISPHGLGRGPRRRFAPRAPLGAAP